MENLCMNCMNTIGGSVDVCPFCEKSISEKQTEPFLPLETVLEERYLIGKGLQIDGEGLSYIGYDKTKKNKVYIREFFPQKLCSRKPNSGHVVPLTEKKRSFDNLMNEFLKCFRSVAKLRNLSSITAVYDIFRENNTAYVVMEWIDGTRLDKYLSKKGGLISWDEARLMFMPLLSSLIKMENFKIRHLGICPSNMLVTSENKIKLIGFATQALRSASSEIDGELYEGCSALEQYSENYEASEATDVYGFMSSLFLTITGKYPLPAQKRLSDERLLIAENILETIPDNVVSSIANALKISPSNRTLSFESVRIELSNSPVFQVKGIGDYNEDFELDSSYETEKKEEKSENKWGLISCISALTLLLVGLGIYIFLLNNTGSLTEPNQNNDPDDSSKVIYQTESNDDSNTPQSNKITAPNLVGRNYANLKEEIAKGNSDYQLVLLSEDFNDNLGEGCIISQTPTAGSEIAEGSTIAVTVSNGPKKRTVPVVTGKTLSEASQIITNSKLKPSQVSEYSKEYPEGIVIGYKNCKEGDSLDYGSEVVIIVSKGIK